MKGGEYAYNLFIHVGYSAGTKKDDWYIYEEHKYALLNYAMTIIRNQGMAEDAVHNAFISIIQKKKNI